MCLGQKQARHPRRHRGGILYGKRSSRVGKGNGSRRRDGMIDPGRFGGHKGEVKATDKIAGEEAIYCARCSGSRASPVALPFTCAPEPRRFLRCFHLCRRQEQRVPPLGVCTHQCPDEYTVLRSSYRAVPVHRVSVTNIGQLSIHLFLVCGRVRALPHPTSRIISYRQFPPAIAVPDPAAATLF